MKSDEMSGLNAPYNASRVPPRIHHDFDHTHSPSIEETNTVADNIINLMTVTVERYLKVVHPFWSKRHVKRWMI